MLKKGHITNLQKQDIVYKNFSGKPTNNFEIVYFIGYKSDMEGTKANSILDYCIEKKISLTLFDYSGHGESGGNFVEGTISSWLSDSRLIIDNLTKKKLIFVGSSMGAWLASLASYYYKKRLKSLILLAPAFNFPQRLILPTMSKETLNTLKTNGYVNLSSDNQYEEPVPLTNKLVEDSQKNLIAKGASKNYDGDFSFHIIQGMLDDIVPWHAALFALEAIEGSENYLHLLKNSNHNLSSPSDVKFILEIISKVAIN